MKWIFCPNCGSWDTEIIDLTDMYVTTYKCKVCDKEFFVNTNDIQN
jgi:DNA-directed RNA polymerase subunit RPC12/RpoP